MIEECARKRLERLRESEEEDIVFLIQQLDLSEEKRNAVLIMEQTAKADAQFHLENWRFYKREIDAIFAGLHEIVALDIEDGRFAEIAHKIQNSYEERAGRDESL